MSILDASLARTSGTANTVLGLAKELGMDAAQVEKALMALAQGSVSASNTIEMVGAGGGLSAGVLSALAARLEGESALKEIATLELAAKRTGLSNETLTKVFTAVGGTDGLSAIADDLSAGLRNLGQGDFFKDLLPFG
ncbi:MAG: hypothetical protein AAF559_07435 [Pseudomonadota bacterium]